MMTTMDDGTRLREARTAVGISRARLAGLAGCSTASLDRIESGAVPRKSRVLRQAWEALNKVEPGRINPGPTKHAGVGSSRDSV